VRKMKLRPSERTRGECDRPDFPGPCRPALASLSSAALSDREAAGVHRVRARIDRVRVLPRIRAVFPATNLAVASKADASPVTLADRQTEQALRRRIQSRYPGHAILGEEYGRAPRRGRTAGYWTRSTATRAFISHCFLFGSLIALERDDGAGFVPVLGGHRPTARPAPALIGHGGGTTRCIAPTPRSARCACERATVWRKQLCSRARPGPLANSAMPARSRRSPVPPACTGPGAICFGYFALATGGADVMLDPQLSYWDVAAIVPIIEGRRRPLSAAGAGGNPLLEPSLVANRGRACTSRCSSACMAGTERRAQT